MWFASIWIFTLELPWQLGAEFFMQHLYDGDAASNTLGWRWVAGVQTQGKHYLASEWNIKKFTNNRFNNIKLNENAPPKVSEKTYSIIKHNFSNPQNIEDKSLLIFDNNLAFEITDFQNYKFKKIYLISNENNVPIIFGVLTTDTMQQALERAGIKNNLGWNYALQAIEMGSLIKNLN